MDAVYWLAVMILIAGTVWIVCSVLKGRAYYLGFDEGFRLGQAAERKRLQSVVRNFDEHLSELAKRANGGR